MYVTSIYVLHMHCNRGGQSSLLKPPSLTFYCSSLHHRAYFNKLVSENHCGWDSKNIWAKPTFFLPDISLCKLKKHIAERCVVPLCKISALKMERECNNKYVYQSTAYKKIFLALHHGCRLVPQSQNALQSKTKTCFVSGVHHSASLVKCKGFFL